MLHIFSPLLVAGLRRYDSRPRQHERAVRVGEAEPNLVEASEWACPCRWCRTPLQLRPVGGVVRPSYALPLERSEDERGLFNSLLPALPRASLCRGGKSRSGNRWRPLPHRRLPAPASPCCRAPLLCARGHHLPLFARPGLRFPQGSPASPCLL